MKNNTQPALKERIEKALEDFTKGRASMHVPPLDTDVDVVLAECSDRLSELKARCAALAAENAGLKSFGDKLNEMHNDLNGEGTGIQGRAEVACQQVALEAAMEEFDAIKTPATDAFLAEVRAQGVDEFLRGSQLPYQIATVLADYDNVDDATLQTVIWSGQPPEPDGDVWHLEYVSRGNAIVRAVLKELRKGVQQ
ncbi:hypothetical protein [Escherichia coli]|uniref:hypothetical protein n=1 Tax=Escherichia coli TaxID=562 RepID=UPI001953653B|nr:hypothetical protein [Escherichia coli]